MFTVKIAPTNLEEKTYKWDWEVIVPGYLSDESFKEIKKLLTSKGYVYAAIRRSFSPHAMVEHTRLVDLDMIPKYDTNRHKSSNINSSNNTSRVNKSQGFDFDEYIATMMQCK